MESYHTSVLLEETLTYLEVREGNLYIDATLGGGGHSFEILKRGGKVLGIDADDEAITHVNENLKSQIENGTLIVKKGNFRDITQIAKESGFEEVSGILFDFGVSSHQLNAAHRGFSFLKEGSLDMRMDMTLGVTAADLVNVLGKKDLYDLFVRFGEEKNAWRIAEAIDSARKNDSLQTTGQLADVVEKAVGRREKIHPATRVFQALRIAVNDELTAIEKAVPDAFDLLHSKGRIVTISFHSLEDRIVKNIFKSLEQNGTGRVITEKPIEPTEEEVVKNSRARSAKMRVIEKL